jgi:hypothetical protein
MWKVVRAFAVGSEDQEDLVQEIALQLWMSLPAFRREAKESTWIYRVAFNTALVWKRHEKRRHAKHERFFELNAAPEAPAEPSAPARDEELDTFLNEQGTGVPSDTMGYGGFEQPDTTGAAAQDTGETGWSDTTGATGVDTSGMSGTSDTSGQSGWDTNGQQSGWDTTGQR